MVNKQTCLKWKRSPYKNPRNNEDISDAVFKKLLRECKVDRWSEEDCDFFHSTSYNPLSGRKISSEKTKSSFKKKCNLLKMKNSPEKMCLEWDLNRMINPRTGRKLQKQTSKIYQSLKKECEPIIQSHKEKRKSEKRNKEDILRKESLIPFDEVSSEIQRLHSELPKLKTMEAFKQWKAEFDELGKKKSKLVGNTLELDKYKKKLGKEIYELYEVYDEAFYKFEKEQEKTKKKRKLGPKVRTFEDDDE